jgi:hypothetical protein
VVVTWERLAPIIRGAREFYLMPRLYEWFEFLYETMRDREGQAPREPDRDLGEPR